MNYIRTKQLESYDESLNKCKITILLALKSFKVQHCLFYAMSSIQLNQLSLTSHIKSIIIYSYFHVLVFTIKIYWIPSNDLHNYYYTFVQRKYNLYLIWCLWISIPYDMESIHMNINFLLNLHIMLSTKIRTITDSKISYWYWQCST